MSRIKKTGLVILVLIIGIQFIQPGRNKSGQVLPADITKAFNVPENVQAILKKSCYDCHSNNSSYSWYARIQPAGWWMASHIKKGKKDLNFSEFGNYSSFRQQSKFNAIYHSIEDGTMPLRSYIFIHRSSKLSKAEKEIITNWANKEKAAFHQNFKKNDETNQP